jgi:RNA polymerase sigma factor (sigma-70 family)
VCCPEFIGRLSVGVRTAAVLFFIWNSQKMHKQSRARGEGGNFSDIEIVDRLLRGVPSAFDLFYQRYERLIYHCIRSRADAADADDIFQSFFEHLMERDYRVLRLWQRGSSLTIYLSTVIRNFVADFRRKKHRRGRRETPEGGLSELETYEPIAEERLTTIIVLKELRRVALRAWATLDGRDRLLVCWKFYRDLTNEAMAERLKPPITGGALRTALSRAQRRFLASLKTLAPEYFPA